MNEEQILTRKDFIKSGFLKMFRFLGDSIIEKIGGDYSPIRAPGAIDEKLFIDTCQKCGKCIEACHQESIRFSGIEAGFLAGFPVIVPSEKPCFVCNDLSCTKSCPSGALQIVPRNEIKMGIAVVNDKCITYSGKECNICMISCPFPGEAILIDESLHPEIKDSCVGCGLCEYFCKYKAITIKSYR